MSDKPRRWFQIHLSTAIVMMFIASGILWQNLRLSGEREREYIMYHDSKFTTYEGVKFKIGWPWAATFYGHGVSEGRGKPTAKETDHNVEAFYLHYPEVVRPSNVEILLNSSWDSKALIANFALTLAVIFLSGFAIEFTMRRKQVRRPPE